MKIIISGRGVDVTPNLKQTVEEKIGKLEKFFAPDTVVNVTLSVEKERHIVEVTIPVKGSVIRSEQTSTDMYVSIDLVEEVIERQMKKYKTKLIDKHRTGQSIADALAPSFVEDGDEEDEDIRIVRFKHFDKRPMFPEDACVQMELSGHDFFVFNNAETGQTNVVYRRKGDTYGLIEPEE